MMNVSESMERMNISESMEQINDSEVTESPQRNELQQPQGWTIVCLILLVFILVGGFLFNLLTMVVMSRKRLRNTAISVYLRAIAVADTLVMLSSVPLDIAYMFPGRIYATQAGCILSTTVRGVSRPLAGWFVMALTIDQFVSVLCERRYSHPEKNKKVAFLVVGLITFGWIVGNLYNFGAWELLPGGRYCVPRPEYRDFKFKINIWILFSLSSFVPSIFMFACNIPIAVSVYRYHRENALHGGKRAKKQASYLVFVVSVSYLMLTVPSGVYHPLMMSEAVEFNELIYWITLIPLYINHSINFFLYIAVGTKFREEIFPLLRIRQPLSEASSEAAGEYAAGQMTTKA